MGHEDAEKRIESALANIHPKRLGADLKITKRLKFHLTEAEFADIRDTAESLNMSISDYLCSLHRYAAPRLRPSHQEDEWVHATPRTRPETRK